MIKVLLDTLKTDIGWYDHDSLIPNCVVVIPPLHFLYFSMSFFSENKRLKHQISFPSVLTHYWQ